MKRSVPLIFLLLGTTVSVFGQSAVYVSPDVPTRPDGPPFYRPWDVVEHVGGAVPYSLEFVVPGDPAIDALHKMDRPGSWLFSVGASNDLAGSLPDEAEPRDIVRADVPAGFYDLFFDGDLVLDPVPPGSNIDAVYLDPDDNGDLVVSFDVPTTISGTLFQPSELVGYTRVGAIPFGWALTGSVIDFATTPGYAPGHANVTGADRAGGRWIVALDIPTRLSPWGSPAPPVGLPGEIVSWDGATWERFRDLQVSGTPGWPIRSQIDALTCQANPGRIDSPTDQITLGKAAGLIVFNCPGSCSSGGDFYGLYEGTIPNYYDHVAMAGQCNNLCPGVFAVIPAAASTYYLLVPNNDKEEGSYCTDSAGIERPQPALVADRCVAQQVLTACP